MSLGAFVSAASEVGKAALEGVKGVTPVSAIRQELPSLFERPDTASAKPSGLEGAKEGAKLETPSASRVENPSMFEKAEARNEGVAYDEKRELKSMVNDYMEDLREKSSCPETIGNIDVSELQRKSPEEIAAKREEFGRQREELKRGWERENGRPWPKYEHDVYSANGKLIRKAGSDYDAHHIQPLSFGGKNEVSNITPVHAEVHYDKQGVHAPDSPYAKLDKYLGGQA